MPPDAWTRFWNDRQPRHGSALAEFAIAFPLQLFISFGLMQLILVAVATLMVNYAAHVACRAALVGEDPARAAAIVLAPLAGYANPVVKTARHTPPLVVPGWGTLRGADRAAEKIHVRLNDHPHPLPVRDSAFDLANPTAYEDDDRYTTTALDAREAFANAFGSDPAGKIRVVVEFDYELLFPVVDGIYALFYRSARQIEPGDQRTATAFGYLDEEGEVATRDYQWIWQPGIGIAANTPRVRMIGGRRHFVIARESSLQRGLPFR